VPDGTHLILYDGVCGLCNRVNQFVLTHDAGHRFDFASLQSEIGRSFVRRFGRDPDRLDTMCVVTHYRSDRPAFLSRSQGCLFIAGTIGGAWRLLALLRVVPARILDAVYDLVARHRYGWFGRYETCLAPRPEHRSRFIDV